MIQTVPFNIDLARIGLNSLINLGLEKMDPQYMNYVGGTIKSKQAFERYGFHAGLGLFQQRDEGDLVSIDSVPQRFRFNIYPVIHSTGIKYSKQAEQKDIYGFIKGQAPMISQSANATLNLLAANTYMNLAFPGGSSVGPDGLTIFNSAHTTVGGSTQSNVGTAPMSYFALEDALTAIRTQTLDRDDMPRQVRGGFDLVCTPYNVAAAIRAVESSQISGTNANDTSKFVSTRINKVWDDQWVGYQMTSMRLAWALIPSAANENGNRFLQVDGLRTHVEYTGQNDTTAMFAHMENAFVNLGWQGMYGSKP